MRQSERGDAQSLEFVFHIRSLLGGVPMRNDIDVLRDVDAVMQQGNHPVSIRICDESE
jgi:hypothetical protein